MGQGFVKNAFGLGLRQSIPFDIHRIGLVNKEWNTSLAEKATTAVANII